MEQDRKNIPDSNENRGSAPFPEEAFNKGDGSYDERVAADKDFLRSKVNSNMPLPQKQDIDELSDDADNERSPKSGRQADNRPA
jgi:hypothetical protein